MITKTTPAHVLELSETIRVEDEEEVRALSGLDPLTALTTGLLHSPDCITGLTRDDRVGLIAGVVPVPHKRVGAVWMICSPLIAGNMREILKTGRMWLDVMTHKYGVLCNVVDARNEAHLRMIKHMGFTIGDPVENYGPGKVTVLNFKRERDV